MKLILYPNDILRTPTKRVPIFDDGLRKIAHDMMEIMLKNKGIGLAAPQVGLNRQIMICWDGDKTSKPIVMCNPEIIKSDFDLIEDVEGCLSFPKKYISVKRPEEVICRYQDLKGKLQRLEAEGLLARCVYHEFDHLHGVLMIDYGEEKIREQ